MWDFPYLNLGVDWEKICFIFCVFFFFLHFILPNDCVEKMICLCYKLIVYNMDEMKIEKCAFLLKSVGVKIQSFCSIVFQIHLNWMFSNIVLNISRCDGIKVPSWIRIVARWLDPIDLVFRFFFFSFVDSFRPHKYLLWCHSFFNSIIVSKKKEK